MSKIVRTRFAPSPSGHLHVGGARTALFCWAYAHARGGQFILRIEDTDQRRSSASAAFAFLEDLTWLGIDWDEGPEHGDSGGGACGPYEQSKRLDHYERAIDLLIERGAAYRAFETPEELDAARARARAAKENYRYDRAALRLDAATVAAYVAEGRPHVVRFKVPDEGEVVVPDVVRGDVRVSTSEIDDFVIRKADGFPTYHLAVVVDDELMGITHVIRGEEHLINTPRHVLIQDALGYTRPVYAHLGLIFNPDGSKMSKRDKDKALRAIVEQRGVSTSQVVNAETFARWRSAKDQQLDLVDLERLADELDVRLPEINVDDFRRAGYLPETLANYLALLGWSPGDDIETFDTDFLLERFDLDRVIKAPARFDREKLLAFSLDAIQALTPEEFVQRYREHCERYHPEFVERLSEKAFRQLALANQSRAKTLEDTLASSRFFVLDDDEIVYQATKAVRKALLNGDPTGCQHLHAVRPLLADVLEWNSAALERVLGAYAEAHADGKLGKVAQPLRVAVSGTTISPAIFDTLAILGRDSVLARIDRCLAKHEVNA